MNGKVFLVSFTVICLGVLWGFYTLFEGAALTSISEREKDHREFRLSQEAAEVVLATDKRLDDGHLLFKSICYKCHVIEPNDTPSSESDYEYMMRVGNMIYSGNKKGMPAYKRRLQQSDIEDLAGFLTKIRQHHKIKRK